MKRKTIIAIAIMVLKAMVIVTARLRERKTERHSDSETGNAIFGLLKQFLTQYVFHPQ